MAVRWACVYFPWEDEQGLAWRVSAKVYREDGEVGDITLRRMVKGAMVEMTVEDAGYGTDVEADLVTECQMRADDAFRHADMEERESKEAALEDKADAAREERLWRRKR